jgi:type II secretory pathway component PulF
MERDPRTDMPLIGWFLNLLWISFLVLLASFVGYFSYFIVPKWEVSLKARGMPLPGWMWVLSETAHRIVKYWYVILIGWAVWILLRRPPSGKPTE